MSAISIQIPTGLPPLRSGVAFETASIRDNTTDERPAKGHAGWSAFRVPRSYKLARRSRLSARKICRVVGIAFAAIGRNRRIRAKWPLHRDAFRRIVAGELCSDDRARRAVLLNPRDCRRNQVVVRIEHWRIGLVVAPQRRSSCSIGLSRCCDKKMHPIIACSEPVSGCQR